jgi:hypothetical protein
VTKLAAEGLCRIHFLEYGLNCVVLRTGRFFPEEDDTHRELFGPNLKANEFLNRRLTVEDAAEAHVVALDRAPALGFEIFLLSAPTPFVRSDAQEIKRAAAKVIERHFPDAPALYARRGWRLPTSIGRVYDAGRIEHVRGFRCATDFGRVLDALRSGQISLRNYFDEHNSRKLLIYPAAWPMPVGQEELLTWLLLSEGAGFKGGAATIEVTGPPGLALSSGVINGAKFHNGQIVGGYELPKDASVEAAQAHLDSKRFALTPAEPGGPGEQRFSAGRRFGCNAGPRRSRSPGLRS